MQLEVGKSYNTRNGRIVTITGYYPQEGSLWTHTGKFVGLDRRDMWWMEDGAFSSRITYEDYDLVSECLSLPEPEPTPASQAPPSKAVAVVAASGQPYIGIATFNTTEVGIGTELFTMPEKAYGHTGFKDPEEMYKAYCALERKSWEDSRRIRDLEGMASIHREVIQRKTVTMADLGKGLKCPQEEIRICLAQGGFPVSQWNQVEVIKEEMIHLIANFKRQERRMTPVLKSYLVNVRLKHPSAYDNGCDLQVDAKTGVEAVRIARKRVKSEMLYDRHDGPLIYTSKRSDK